MKHLLATVLMALVPTIASPFIDPLASARQELTANKEEMVALKHDLSANASTTASESLSKLKASRGKIDDGLREIADTKTQMSILRNLSKLVDPKAKKPLGQLSASYDATATRVKQLSVQFDKLAKPLSAKLAQTEQELKAIVQDGGLIDQITIAQEKALKHLQGLGSLLFGPAANSDEDGDETPLAQASQEDRAPQGHQPFQSDTNAGGSKSLEA